jgi:hypothetical protein
MIRKTVLALAALVAVGGASLAPTVASAHYYGGGYGYGYQSYYKPHYGHSYYRPFYRSYRYGY